MGPSGATDQEPGVQGVPEERPSTLAPREQEEHWGQKAGTEDSLEVGACRAGGGRRQLGVDCREVWLPGGLQDGPRLAAPEEGQSCRGKSALPPDTGQLASPGPSQLPRPSQRVSAGVTVSLGDTGCVWGHLWFW